MDSCIAFTSVQQLLWLVNRLKEDIRFLAHDYQQTCFCIIISSVTIELSIFQSNFLQILPLAAGVADRAAHA